MTELLMLADPLDTSGQWVVNERKLLQNHVSILLNVCQDSTLLPLLIM